MVQYQWVVQYQWMVQYQGITEWPVTHLSHMQDMQIIIAWLCSCWLLFAKLLTFIDIMYG